jgi:hypothetical protein
MQPNLNDQYALAEIGYRRDQVTHDFRSAQGRGHSRLAHRWHRHTRLAVVQPYGDARA